MTVAEFEQSAIDLQAQTDLKKLQGAWISITGRRPVEFLIAGRHFTARFLDGALYMGTFHLFSEQEPREMVMWIDEGPEQHRGRIAWCIYAFEEELLRWCPADLESFERLTAFPADTDRRHLCTVFQRERPKSRGRGRGQGTVKNVSSRESRGSRKD